MVQKFQIQVINKGAVQVPISASSLPSYLHKQEKSLSPLEFLFLGLCLQVFVSFSLNIPVREKKNSMFPIDIIPKPQESQICDITFMTCQQNMMSHLKSVEKTSDDII